MASTADIKALYDHHFDPKKMTKMYLTPTSTFHADSFIQAIPRVEKFFSSGAVKGGTLLEMSFAPLVHCSLPASQYFTDSYFACPNDKAIEEVQNWVKNKPGSLDITDIIKSVAALLGDSARNLFGISLGDTFGSVLASVTGSLTQAVPSVAPGVWNEIQNVFRRKVKHVLPCNFMSSNPVAPTVLPPVDCLALSYSLEYFAADEKSYSDALRNASSLLKKGGHLMMYACLGATFHKVEDVTFPVFCLQEDLVRKILKEQSIKILEEHTMKRKTQGSFDVSDFKSHLFITAYKE